LCTTHPLPYRHRSGASSVYQRYELSRPAAAFSPYFVGNRVQKTVLLGDERSGEMNAGVSFPKVDCLARSVSRNVALLEDKELSTDLTHDRQ